MPTITIDLTAQQAQRVSDAFEFAMGTPPTMADVRQHLVRELKAFVLNQEKRKAEEQIVIPDLGVV